jgi:hypothetical protein
VVESNDVQSYEHVATVFVGNPSMPFTSDPSQATKPSAFTAQSKSTGGPKSMMLPEELTSSTPSNLAMCSDGVPKHQYEPSIARPHPPKSSAIAGGRGAALAVPAPPPGSVESSPEQPQRCVAANATIATARAQV